MSSEGVFFNLNTHKYEFSHLKCSICGKDIPSFGVSPIKVTYGDLDKCMLFELLKNLTNIQLCSDCNLPLVRCRIGLDYMTLLQKYVDDLSGCFMCRIKYRLAPFPITTGEIEVLVLRRLQFKYKLLVTGNDNICQLCEKLFKDLVNLHVLYHNYILKTVNLDRRTLLDKLQLQCLNENPFRVYKNFELNSALVLSEKTSEDNLPPSTCASSSGCNNSWSTFEDYSDSVSTFVDYDKLKSSNSSTTSQESSNLSISDGEPSTSDYTIPENIPTTSTRTCPCCGFIETYDTEIDANEDLINVTQNAHSDEESNLECDASETLAESVHYFPHSLWRVDDTDSITMIKKNTYEVLLFNPRTINMKVLRNTYEDVFTHLLTVVNVIVGDGCDSIVDNIMSKLNNFKTKRVNKDVSLVILDKMVDDWEYVMNTVLTNITAVFDKNFKIPILKSFSERCPRQVHLAKLAFLNVIINFLDKLPIIYRDISFIRLYIKEDTV
ncbi:hypothetical protein RN001_015954 [Aquatica leii]|uniref:Uncharacterized protein n=1 Tax=Aquatica leii TaxID=1421715 RepID=A0AAN7SMX3_9COLE|nr:hypothetical protein RN001_015954 [Aquatica leii]